MSARKPPRQGQVDPYRQPHLTLQMNRSGPVTVIIVSGEVDADNAHLIPELVESLTNKAAQRLLLDLARVTFIGAAGVQALLRVRDAVNVRAGQLILRNPAQSVLTVLAGTRVIRGFQIHTTTQGQDSPPSLQPAQPGVG